MPLGLIRLRLNDNWSKLDRCRYRDRKGRMEQTEEATPRRTNARRRQPPIKVWLTQDERAEVAERAAQTGMSLSAYLRAAGLNHQIKSIADADAVADLLKVPADLGRVAGLLKLWLAEKRGIGAPAFDVDRMMVQFRQLQSEIRDKAGAALYDR